MTSRSFWHVYRPRTLVATLLSFAVGCAWVYPPAALPFVAVSLGIWRSDVKQIKNGAAI